jgi:hypothetical protein
MLEKLAQFAVFGWLYWVLRSLPCLFQIAAAHELRCGGKYAYTARGPNSPEWGEIVWRMAGGWCG